MTWFQFSQLSYRSLLTRKPSKYNEQEISIDLKKDYSHLQLQPSASSSSSDSAPPSPVSRAPARRALPQVEEAVDDGVHHRVGAGEDEQQVLDALVHVGEGLLRKRLPN